MLKLEIFLSHLQIFYTDHKFLRSVTEANPWSRQTVQPDDASWKRLEDIFATRLDDVLKTLLQGALKTSWKPLEDGFKTYGHYENIGLDQEVLKTSSRRILKTYNYGEYIRLVQDVMFAGYESICYYNTDQMTIQHRLAKRSKQCTR